MEPSRQKSPILQDRAADRAAVRPGSPGLSSLLTLQESLGNQSLLGLLAAGRLQRKPAVHQTDSVSEQDVQTTGKDDKDPPHQCEDDAALDAEYDEWIHYDPQKDSEEARLVARINKEIFGPINQERNKIAADSFENFEAKRAAFPNGLLPGSSPALEKLFYTHSYDWLHSSNLQDRKNQQMNGITLPMDDLSPTGKMVPHIFGESGPPGTLWSYTGEKAAKISGSELDSQISPDGIVGEDSVSGYAEFESNDQRIFVPQLGFGSKPKIDRRQVMCGEAPVVKPGRAKRRDGPTGQAVTGSSLSDMLHGGKHFFGKGTKPTITGKGEIIGKRDAPGKPVYWYFHELPDDLDKRAKVDETMRKKADKIMEEKRTHHESLKQYYLERAAFIAKYQGYLK